MGNICNVIPLQETNIDDKANARALCVDLSGNPITFEADSAIAQKLSVDIEPIQDLHGYSGAWFGGARKNKLNIPSSVVTTEDHGVTFTITRNEGGAVTEIDVDGTADGEASVSFNTPLPLGSVTMTGAPSDGGGNYVIYRWDADFHNAKVDRGSGVTFTNETANNRFKIIVVSGTVANHVKFYPMVRLSTVSDATFEPYSNICPISGRTETAVTTRNADNTESHTASLSFGQTVYGCHVDLKTGVMTVTDVLMTYTGAQEENWSKSAITACDIYMLWDTTMNASKAFKISEFTRAGSAVNSIGYAWRGSQDVQIRFGFAEYNTTDLDSFKAWLASNPLQVCYALATPITVQLTPAELELLEGYNYITADGNINISLVPENVIDYVMGQIISAMGTNESGRTTASRAYSAKEYFYKDGKMYKCLTSIASGATFTVGTNCAETSIFAELTALNA